MKRNDTLIWLDLEMTGLDPETQTILEIGCIVTDSDLNVLATVPAVVIHHSDDALAAMDPWCIKQHGVSGLTDRARQSKVSLAEAEAQVLQILQEVCLPRTSPLCGNSIGQDRRFLYKFMPTLNDFFHYRNIDVSSIKELVRRWYPKDHQAPDKEKTHEVMDDIRGSIDELKHYRSKIFR